MATPNMYVRNGPIAGGAQGAGGVEYGAPQVFEIRHGDRCAVTPLRAGCQPIANGFHGCGFVGFRIVTICQFRSGACRRRLGRRYAFERQGQAVGQQARTDYEIGRASCRERV